MEDRETMATAVLYTRLEAIVLTRLRLDGQSSGACNAPAVLNIIVVVAANQKCSKLWTLPEVVPAGPLLSLHLSGFQILVTIRSVLMLWSK